MISTISPVTDLKRLVSPDFGGRFPGSEGAARAAAYLAGRLAELGFGPAGTEGYFTPVQVPAARLTGPVTLMVGKQALAHRLDFGEVAPQSRGATVQGPLLVLTDDRAVPAEALVGAVVLVPKRPDGFDQPATVAAAAEAGVAALLVERGEPEWFHKTIFGSAANRIPVIALRKSVAAELARQEDERVLLDLPLAYGSWSCQNVLGLLPGANPDLTIALTAHYDHVGDDPGGFRFPGAGDNASGVVTILGAAEILARQGAPLPFNLLVAFLTGEEAGLIGARALTANPPVPIAAAINVDGMGTEPAIRKLVLGQTRPGDWLANLGASYLIERGIEPVWSRGGTDAIALQEAGIPALGLAHARTAGRPAPLHTPADDLSAIDPGALAAGSQLVADLVNRIAQNPMFIRKDEYQHA
ncbi:MAG: M28 family metallopeptidase [Bacillota bacterium]